MLIPTHRLNGESMFKKRKLQTIENRAADVVVIGGGIVGCSAAYYLARRGVSVILCEKGDVGLEQSSRNWGFVRQQGRGEAELPLMMACNQI